MHSPLISSVLVVLTAGSGSDSQDLPTICGQFPVISMVSLVRINHGSSVAHFEIIILKQNLNLFPLLTSYCIT